MRLCSISSGSSGNCVYLESEHTRVLIDAGTSGRQIEVLLKSMGVDPRTLDGIFVTHEHGDHIHGVGVLSRRFDIPIFANEKTWLAMRKRIGKIVPRNIYVFENNRYFSFQDIDVFPFSIFHDAADPVGYVFSQDDDKVTVLTDTGYINEHMKETIVGSQIYYLEANHDIEMLRVGPYPPELKQRILSQHGHMSNIDTANVLSEILSGEGESVILAHLSEENNLPDLAYHTVDDLLLEDGLDTNRDMRLIVAPRYQPSCIFDTRKP